MIHYIPSCKGDNMKIIAENNGFRLCFCPDKVNRYAVYKTCSMSPSSDLHYDMMFVQSPIMTSKIKSFFTKQQIQTAKAKVHGIKYTRKFKI